MDYNIFYRSARSISILRQKVINDQQILIMTGVTIGSIAYYSVVHFDQTPYIFVDRLCLPGNDY